METLIFSIIAFFSGAIPFSIILTKILSGKDKGKTGEILEINRKIEKVKVKSVNMIKRHTKPTKENKGGIISKESFIHQSNIKNIDVKKTDEKVAGKK